MTYSEAIEYLFNSAPLFQNIGAGAYKEGLHNTNVLDEHFGHPHQSFKTIHVGGTNGKGSVSHTLASIMQSAGYKVGLYTSPHLKDFRERIKVNGKMIPEERVVRFVEEEKHFFAPLHPSFFELTTALAFQYFKEEKIDVAVIEVGLGGRLDCTNIISPELSIITNISFDHVQFLGHNLADIAKEKAGIIKPNTPVVIGEVNGHQEVKDVFMHKALETKSKIIFSEEKGEIISHEINPLGGRDYITKNHGHIQAQLGGLCQEKNTATILSAVEELTHLGFRISEENIHKGFSCVTEETGLNGRWQKLSESPLTICDTGHNVAGIEYIVKQLEGMKYKTLRMVIGMVNDKDVSTVLSILPKEAEYYFTQASVKRALPANELKEKAKGTGLKGEDFQDVRTAYLTAKEEAHPDDLIFVGGSSFIVADMLNSII